MAKFIFQFVVAFTLGLVVSTVTYRMGLFEGGSAALLPLFIAALIAYRIAFMVSKSPLLSRLIGVAASALYLAYPIPNSNVHYTPTMLLLLAAIGGLIILAPRSRAERGAGSGQGPRSEFDHFKTAGKAAFTGSHFSLTLDFEANTVRLATTKASWVKAEGESGAAGHQVDRTAALYQLSFNPRETRSNMKSVYVSNSTTSSNAVIGTTHHSLPGSYHDAPDGTSTMSITLRDAHEALNAQGFPYVAQGPGAIVIHFNKLPDIQRYRFEAFWNAVKERVEQSYKTFSDDIDARREVLFKQMQADEEARATAAAKAETERLRQADSDMRERLQQLVAGAGMAGDFRIWSAKEDRLYYLLAADRSGKAVIVSGEERWQGLLNGAKARIVAANPHEKTAEHLEIEVKDPDYEARHVARRRLRLMHGATSAQLQEWSDRIAILSEKVTPA